MSDKDAGGIQNTLRLIKDLLVVLILLAMFIGIVVIILNIGTLFSAIGSFLKPNNQNQNYNPNNPDQNYNNQNYTPDQNFNNQNGTNNSMNKSKNNPLSTLGPQLKAAVDSGDWNTADNIMGTIDSMSSQLPIEIQNLLPQVDQAVRNRDRATFDSLAQQIQALIKQ
jgi:hypothetical protein